ncbi:MAG: FAD-dependent oxidoreductase, partial [Anaerolineae bacterium]|nr:FAD-dependent oxidoreductase [Anaerolineae bacterium]
MTISHWQIDASSDVRSVDFLVIGAGLLGCSAAYFAAQAGRDVLIVEKNDLAMGASGRNAGFIMAGLDTHYHHAVEKYGAEVVNEAWDISHQAIAFWKKIAAEAHVPLEQVGSMLLAESEAEAADLALASEALTAAGVHHIYHQSDPTGRGFFAAIERPDDCSVQPVKLVQAVFAASGADLLPNCEVYAIEQQ